MQFNKILVAVDNSSYSTAAAIAGFQLAHKLQAQVALLYVSEVIVNLHSSPDALMPMDMPLDVITALKEETDKTFSRLEEEFGFNMDVVRLNPQGSPRMEIISASEKWGADLIVMGTHGHTGITHLLMGSVAEYIVRHSKVPVMVVPFTKADE